MKMKYREVLTAALALAKRDRVKLLNELADNLDPPEDDFDDADGPVFSTDGMSPKELMAELQRRHEEAMRDPSVMIPWEVVKREMEEEIAHGTRTPSARKARTAQGTPIPRQGRPNPAKSVQGIH
jgi:hypothetical protein